MNATIPAICQNPDCGAVFFSSSLFATPAGSSINLKNCGLGPCPKCKTSGSIPDGRYVVLDSGTAYLPASLRDIAVLQRALKLIEQERKKKVSPEVIKRKAKKKVPELRTLWDLIPRKRSEAYVLLGIMVTLFGVLLNSCSKKNDTQASQTIAIPPELHRVISEMREIRKWPNKTPEPTPTTVTFPAAQHSGRRQP